MQQNLSNPMGVITEGENIFSIIRQEKNDFINNYIQPIDGWSFSQYQTIKRIHLYSNDKFENGQYYLGREKIFFNVVNNPVELAQTLLDFDTKHVKAYSRALNSYDKLFLFNKEAEYYFKKTKFSSILNEISEGVSRYGSHVIKKTKGGIESCDLRKLMLDPAVDRIHNSRFITIVHDYTASELREQGEKNGWDKDAVEKAIKSFGNTNTPDSYMDAYGNLNQIRSSPYIRVYERWGEVPEKLFGGKSKKMVKSLFMVAGADEQTRNAEGLAVGEEGIVLFKTKWHKAYPFKDFHYTKTKGRWLGVGIVEKLFPVQIRFNELKNQQRFAMELSSKHIFQSKDRNVSNNLLTDVDNGQVLSVKNEITPVVNEERNLSAFNKEEQTYYKQAQDITFSYESVRGDMGAETTATTASISTQRSSSVFELKRENIGNDLRDFLNDFVKDDIIRDITPEHILVFTGNVSEVNIFDDKFAQAKTNSYFLENLLNGKIIEAPELESYKNKILMDLKRGAIDRAVIIEKDYFKDSDLWLDFNLTNEAFDASTVFSNSNSVLIALAQNPTILQDPRLKVVFYKYMESLGINPTEIELAEKSMQSMTGQVGGSAFPAVSPGPEQMMQLGGGQEGGVKSGTSNMPQMAQKMMAGMQ
jgi:hypothetical protein